MEPIDLPAIERLDDSVLLLADSINELVYGLLGCFVVALGFCYLILKYHRIISGLSAYRRGRFSSEKASRLFDMGKLEELLSYTEKCAKKYPNDVEIRFYIGLAFYARGDLQEAKRELEAAASINPHYRELVSAYLEAIEEHEMLDPAAQSH